MATQADVRRIALSFPGTEEAPNRFAFFVRSEDKRREIVWVWMERVDLKKARVPQPGVVAIRTATIEDREFLLGADPKKFFTEPHYSGFPAILARLKEVTVRDLKLLIAEAWTSQAPKALLASLDKPRSRNEA